MRRNWQKTDGHRIVNKGYSMKYLLAIAMIGVVFSGCATPSGYFNVDAYNSSGECLTKNVSFTTAGSSLYSTINGTCSAFPKSTVIIRNAKTGEQLAGVSPHQCK